MTTRTRLDEQDKATRSLDDFVPEEDPKQRGGLIYKASAPLLAKDGTQRGAVTIVFTERTQDFEVFLER